MNHQPGNYLKTNKNDKRLISRRHKEPLQINTKNNPIEKQAKNHVSISLKKKTIIDNKCITNFISNHKKCKLKPQYNFNSYLISWQECEVIKTIII